MHDIITFAGNYWYLLGAFIVILTALCYLETQSKVRGVPLLSVSDATASINHHQAKVLDIRPEPTFRAGHIIDAINIPEQALPDKLTRLNKYKDKPIIVVCENGQHSVKSANLLKQANFTQVSILQGGLVSWRADNIPLVKEA